LRARAPDGQRGDDGEEEGLHGVGSFGSWKNELLAA
jgi:hypothetical protein